MRRRHYQDDGQTKLAEEGVATEFKVQIGFRFLPPVVGLGKNESGDFEKLLSMVL